MYDMNIFCLWVPRQLINSYDVKSNIVVVCKHFYFVFTQILVAPILKLGCGHSFNLKCFLYLFLIHVFPAPTFSLVSHRFTTTLNLLLHPEEINPETAVPDIHGTK